jgi:Spy/CpxP family protein refolding chaperone
MRNILRFSAAALLGLFFGIAPALAQSAGPDEAVQPNGTVTQTLALTAGQRSAIYNIVIRQRAKPHADQIAVTVGAPVPPTIDLADLPDQATANNPSTALLKYAMVHGDVVVVDPVAMRVVDVIRNGAKP